MGWTRAIAVIVFAAGISAAHAETPTSSAPGPAPSPSQSTTKPKPSAMAEIGKVEAYLNGIHTLKAQFIQRGPDGSVAEGTVSLERPGRLRFQYGDDVPLLLVSDGTTLTFVDYDVKQVTRWPIMDTSLGILVAKTIDFKGKMIVSSTAGDDGLLRVTVQDPKRLDEGYITLIFEQHPLTLRAWDAVDPQGMVTRVTLVNAETNVALDNSLFTFKDPRALPFSRGHQRRRICGKRSRKCDRKGVAACLLNFAHLYLDKMRQDRATGYFPPDVRLVPLVMAQVLSPFACANRLSDNIRYFARSVSPWPGDLFCLEGPGMAAKIAP